ncbi:hypothetical protein D9M68_953020 [compost metagenome]
MQLVEQVAGHRSELGFVGTHQLDLGLAVVVVPVDVTGLGKFAQHRFRHVLGQKVVKRDMGKRGSLRVFVGALGRQGRVFRVIKNKAGAQSVCIHCVLLDTVRSHPCREPSIDPCQ